MEFVEGAEGKGTNARYAWGVIIDCKSFVYSLALTTRNLDRAVSWLRYNSSSMKMTINSLAA